MALLFVKKWRNENFCQKTAQNSMFSKCLQLGYQYVSLHTPTTCMLCMILLMVTPTLKLQLVTEIIVEPACR